MGWGSRKTSLQKHGVRRGPMAKSMITLGNSLLAKADKTTAAHEEPREASTPAPQRTNLNNCLRVTLAAALWGGTVKMESAHEKRRGAVTSVRCWACRTGQRRSSGAWANRIEVEVWSRWTCFRLKWRWNSRRMRNHTKIMTSIQEQLRENLKQCQSSVRQLPQRQRIGVPPRLQKG